MPKVGRPQPDKLTPIPLIQRQDQSIDSSMDACCGILWILTANCTRTDTDVQDLRWHETSQP